MLQRNPGSLGGVYVGWALGHREAEWSPLPQSFGGPCWRDPHMDFTSIASRQAFEGLPWKRRHTNATVRHQEEERVL